MATQHMPAASNQNVPQFDPVKPCELQCYFNEVAQLFCDCSITDETDKKFHTVHYLDCDTVDTWKQLLEYDAVHSYDAFKEAVHKLYPGSRLGSKWSISDLDKLIGETACIGLVTSEDIAQYYRSFFNISEYLVGQGIIVCSDQSRMFIRVFRADQLEWILNRLSIAVPNQAANVPYSLDAIHKAIDFIFDGPACYFQLLPNFSFHNAASSSPLYSPYVLYAAPAAPAPASISVPSAPAIKTEDFGALFKRMTQTIITALGTTHREPSAPCTYGNDTCNGCRQTGHYITDCPTIERLVNEGKCRRNAEGRIVLPGGAWSMKESAVTFRYTAPDISDLRSFSADHSFEHCLLPWTSRSLEIVA
jgi:hypothetical protein